MKQTILGMPPALYRQKLRQRSFLCIAVATGTLALNILFTALRTDSNHNLMLFLNIVADILAGLFLLPFISLRILPQKRLLQLTQQPACPAPTIHTSTFSTICFIIINLSKTRKLWSKGTKLP